MRDDVPPAGCSRPAANWGVVSSFRKFDHTTAVLAVQQCSAVQCSAFPRYPSQSCQRRKMSAYIPCHVCGDSTHEVIVVCSACEVLVHPVHDLLYTTWQNRRTPPSTNPLFPHLIVIETYYPNSAAIRSRKSLREIGTASHAKNSSSRTLSAQYRPRMGASTCRKVRLRAHTLNR